MQNKHIAARPAAQNVALLRRFALASLLLPTLALAAGNAILVSAPADPGNTSGAGASGSRPSASFDGRYVAFVSSSTVLTSGSGGSGAQVYVRDTVSGSTVLASASTAGATVRANGASSAPEISGEGRYVTFQSSATNLVANDTNGVDDIFRRDLLTGTTVLVSHAPAGGAANGPSRNPDISADGRYVVFSSRASNLVAASVGEFYNIYRSDLSEGTTILVSILDAPGNGDSDHPSISGDGTKIAFQTLATNFYWTDQNGRSDVYLWYGDGWLQPMIASGSNTGDAESIEPSISPNGNYVAFTAKGSVQTDDLYFSSNNGQYNVFCYEAGWGIRVASVGLGDLLSGQDSAHPSVSDDGFVAFESIGPHFVSNYPNLEQRRNIIVRNLAGGFSTIASRRTDGSPGANAAFNASISGNGTFVTFDSADAGYTTQDANGGSDVFRAPVDKAVPPPSLDVLDWTDSERDGYTASAIVTVTPTTATESISFEASVVAGTATWGDFGSPQTTPFFIWPSESYKIVEVPIYGDNVQEPDESFKLHISNVQNAAVADADATMTILNDDGPALPVMTFADYPHVLEGNSGTKQLVYTISLSFAPTVPVTYDIATTGGTATPGSDYIAKALTGQVIPAGQTSATFSVSVNGDTVHEGFETIRVEFNNVTNAYVGNNMSQGEILEDDISITVSDASIVEGNSGSKQMNFAVSLSQPPIAPVSFEISTSSGTAAAGSDFEGNWYSVTFLPGGTGVWNFPVTVSGDTAVEPDETFLVTLVNVNGGVVNRAQAVGTITNDDGGVGPGPTLSIGDVSISEGNSLTRTATFTVTLSAAQTVPVFFDVATANGTATAGSDYVAKALTGQRITIGSTSKIFTVVINGDSTAEPDETFLVNISNPVGGVTIADAQAVGTITNDDGTSGPTLSIGDISVAEGNSGTHLATYTVSLSAPTAADVTFEYATAPGTATGNSDYLTSTAIRAIPAGQTSAQFDVVINGDFDFEPDEAFTINLSNPTGATIADGQAVVTILNDDASTVPTLSISDASVVEGNSGSTMMAFTVSLSAPSAASVSFNVATTNGTAIVGSDFDAPAAVGLIAAGSTSTTVQVPVKGDTVPEANETFTVNLSNPAFATIADGQATGTITNDDSAGGGGPTLSIGDVSISEGNSLTKTATFTVTLSAPQTVPVFFDATTVNGTATAGSDYVAKALTGQRIVIGATSKTFTVVINGDTTSEPDETFLVNVSNPVGGGVTIADAQAVATITNDDAPATPALSIADVTIAEGNAGTKLATFTVSLPQVATAPVIFDIGTTEGSAIAGSDYVESILSDQTIAAGQSSKTFSVTINGDTTVEPNESFTVNIANVRGGTISDGSAVGTITNDDVGGPALSIGDVSISEGNSGTKTATFTVSLSAPSASAVTYTIATANQTANSGSDYLGGIFEESIPAGQTSKSFAVTINGDTAVEPNETYAVNLSNVGGATVADGQAIGTITNDDSAGGPTLSIGDVSISEGNSLTKIATFTVTLSAPQTVPVFFDAATANGTATAGSDYVAKALTGQRITIGSTSKTFTVVINGDTSSEPDETFLVNISNPVGGVTIADAQAVGTITNDDAAATPTLSIADLSIAEGNAGTQVATFTVSLSPAAAGTVTYDIATSNGTATAGSDYVAASLVGQTITAGGTSKTFAVTINGDTAVEPNETFTVTLSNVSGATLGDGSATGTITNDDSTGGGGPSLSIADLSISEGNSGTKIATFTVTLSAAQAVPVFFDAATANGTATAGSDYVAKVLTDQRIVIGATSKTFTVVIGGDTVAEPNETFTVNLSNPVGGVTIADGQAIGTITNDDAAALSAARFDAGGLVDDLDDGNRAPQVTKDEYALLLFDTATKLCERTNAATIVGIDGVENRNVLADLAEAANATCSSKPRYQAVMAEQGSTGFLIEATAETDARGVAVLAAPTLDEKAGITSLSVQASGHERALTVLLPTALSTQATARSTQLQALGQSVQATLKADPQARLLLIGGVTLTTLRDLSTRDLPKLPGQTLPAERILLSPALLKEFSRSKVEFLPPTRTGTTTQVLQLQR